jgi:hypothetical protein
MNQLRLSSFVLTYLLFAQCTYKHVSIQQSDSSKVKLIDSMAYIEFTNPIASLGKITSGEKVGMDFVFYNRGGQNLVIRNAKVSCGCTAPEWDKKPIQPGQQGVIRIIYDSSGELGIQNKSVQIISNARNKETDIIISAEVVN